MKHIIKSIHWFLVEGILTFALVLSILVVGALATGCGTTRSTEKINSYDAAGNLMSERTSTISRRGLFVKSTALDISGSTEYEVTDKSGKVLKSERSGKAASISSDPDEEAIAAGGTAAGKVIGEAAKAVISKP